MRIKWHIEPTDVSAVKALYDRMHSNFVVQERIERNLKGNRSRRFSRADFWHAHVACLLTTQQRSGPDSPVNNLVTSKPFPLHLRKCREQGVHKIFQKVLSDHGGIRRGKTITEQANYNLIWLEDGGWRDVELLFGRLVTESNPDLERSAARQSSKWFRGFGPKQSRNLLQALGLTKYEIPLDSRITKWLNANGFPIKLTASALGDDAYYEFIMDGIKELCARAGLFPCIFDAMVFASFDKGTWTKKNLMW